MPLTALFVSAVDATPIDGHTAERIARTALMGLDPEGHHDLSATMEAVCDGVGSVLAYAIELTPQGFLVISGDASLPPVIAYSLDASLHAPGERENPLLALVRLDLESRMARGGAIEPSWREHRHGQGVPQNNDVPFACGRDSRQWPPAGATSTGGWVTTRWTQDPPYNAFCPIDPTTDSRSLAGCPAVAMAQILTYHRSLNGTRFDDADDYFHNYAGQYWIDNDHDAHGFPSFPELNAHLDTLEAHYQSQVPLTATDKAAAVFSCGVAARQVYSSQGSGTFGVNQAHQAYLRFGHVEVELATASTPLFRQRLAVNMIDGLPAHLAVVTPQWNAGHNLVVDGYNTNGYFHLNFGWGGYADAWYDLPVGLPYNLTVIEGVILDVGSNLTYPDGNDHPMAATLVPPGIEGASFTIDRAGDTDWFRFLVEEAADLQIHSETVFGCELDLTFRLYGPHAEDGADVQPDSFVASDDNSYGDLQPALTYAALEPGYYFLRVSVADPPAGGEAIGAYLLTLQGASAGSGGPVAVAVSLDPVHPNPARERVTLRFTLGDDSAATVMVFDLTGRRIRTLARGWHAAGVHTVTWDGTDTRGREVPGGVYVCRMVADGVSRARPVVILR